MKWCKLELLEQNMSLDWKGHAWNTRLGWNWRVEDLRFPTRSRKAKPKSFHFGLIFPKSELATKVSKVGSFYSWRFPFSWVSILGFGLLDDPSLLLGPMPHLNPNLSPLNQPHLGLVHMQKSDWKSLSLCRTFPSKKPYFTNLNPSPLF